MPQAAAALQKLFSLPEFVESSTQVPKSANADYLFDPAAGHVKFHLAWKAYWWLVVENKGLYSLCNPYMIYSLIPY